MNPIILSKKEDIIAWLQSQQINNYDLIPSDKYGWEVNVNESATVYIGTSDFYLVKFSKIQGDFTFSVNYRFEISLDSIEFAPKFVAGSVSMCHCEISSLVGSGLSEIKGDFEVRGNKLTSLEGAPLIVGGNYDCSENLLSSLQGCPEEIQGSFICYRNQFQTLEGGPKKVNKDYKCTWNSLSSLIGSPSFVGGDFSADNCQLPSLEFSPNHVGGSFQLSNNKIVSLKGAPEYIGKDLYLTGNRLSNLDFFPKNLKHKVFLNANYLPAPYQGLEDSHLIYELHRIKEEKVILSQTLAIPQPGAPTMENFKI